MGQLSKVASEIMTRNHFEAIKSIIHLAENSDSEVDASKNKDKLFKVRPSFEHLQNNFRKYQWIKTYL